MLKAIMVIIIISIVAIRFNFVDVSGNKTVENLGEIGTTLSEAGVNLAQQAKQKAQPTGWVQHTAPAKGQPPKVIPYEGYYLCWGTASNAVPASKYTVRKVGEIGARAFEVNSSDAVARPIFILLAGSKAEAHEFAPENC